MQAQQPDFVQHRRPRRKQFSWMRWVLVIAAILFLTTGTIVGIIQGNLSSTLSLVFNALGVVFALLQWLLPNSASTSEPATTSPSVPDIIVHVPASQPLPSLPPDTSAHRVLVGLPPPTNAKTIQQRENVVRDIYLYLSQPETTAIVLTGIGGAGKSTLAALVYRYVEEQRHEGNGLFQDESIWLTVNESVTMVDLVGTLFEALNKPLPDFSRLSPQSQAAVLFHALNMAEKARLVILDQFENLLDWQTGHALADRPGVGEWLDAINSQPCRCRFLLTSRPWPRGTREDPPTHLQEYRIAGLELAEGVELLRKRGIEATDAELQAVVERCGGHAFALTLLASLVRNHHLPLGIMLKDPSYVRLWRGNIAHNLLDYIFTKQLSEAQRTLLLAFSVYREPVPFHAVQALTGEGAAFPGDEFLSALQALHTQHLLQASGGGSYQLHAIVAGYTQEHLERSGGQTAEKTRQEAHARAAQYYLQQVAANCPPREKRRRISDVHDLIEAVWQYCQAEQWQHAYDLMVREDLFADLSRWGGNAILLELYQLLPLEKWHPEDVYRVRIYIDLGEIYRVIGQNEPALEHLEQGLSLCQKIGDHREEGRALTYLGRVHNPMGNKQQALAYYEQALLVLREVGDRAGESVVINNLGYVHFDLGQMDRAEGYYEQGLRMYREVGDRRGEGTTLYSLGHVYDALGLTDRALQFYEQALSILKEVGDRGWEGITLSNLGLLYSEMGQNEQALNYCKEGLSISREVGDRAREGWALYQLGRVYQSWGKNTEAMKLYEQALSPLRESGDRRGEAKALAHLGQVRGHLGEGGHVWSYFREGLGILRKVGDRWGEGQTLFNLGKLCFEKGRYDVALACFLLTRSIFEEVRSPDRSGVQSGIESLRKEIGKERYVILLTKVELQADQIVEDMLGEEE